MIYISWAVVIYFLLVIIITVTTYNFDWKLNKKRKKNDKYLRTLIDKYSHLLSFHLEPIYQSNPLAKEEINFGNGMNWFYSTVYHDIPFRICITTERPFSIDRFTFTLCQAEHNSRLVLSDVCLNQKFYENIIDGIDNAVKFILEADREGYGQRLQKKIDTLNCVSEWEQKTQKLINLGVRFSHVENKIVDALSLDEEELDLLIELYQLKEKEIE